MLRLTATALTAGILLFVGWTAFHQSAYADPEPFQKNGILYGVYIKERSASDPWKLVAKYNTRAEAAARVVLMMRHGGQFAVQLFEIPELRPFLPKDLSKTLNPGSPFAKDLSKTLKPNPSIAQKPNKLADLNFGDKGDVKFGAGLHADLAVMSFSAVIHGGKYLFSGSVKNVGRAPYEGGRVLHLFVVNTPLGTNLMAPVPVPPLQPGQTWRMSSVALPVGSVQTNNPYSVEFKLRVSAAQTDFNTQNDWARAVVTLR